VKTIGDAVMATFLAPLDALRASVQMLEEIDAFNRSRGTKDIILKIGMHKGSAIAVTLNDRLDYFGQTVNIASRVQSLADSEEIYLTADVQQDEAVREFLRSMRVEPRSAALKGIQDKVNVYRVTPETVAVG
jgi:class 3 adenylate cyclase